MSKLAAYDKEYAAKDRKKAEFFRHDYVYRRNVATRFFTLLGSFIIIIFYFMHRIIIDGLDVLDLTGEMPNDLIRMGILVILMQVAYTLIGFWAHARDYNAAQERINEYTENMYKLSQMLDAAAEMDGRGRAREDAAGRYEPDDAYYSED
jgi:hypothetical protein